MSLLLASDLHLTDSARDSYRWKLLPWIKQQVIDNGVSQVLLLGDSTDQKDRRSSSLVNQFINQLTDLSECCDVFVLRGNHDGIEENLPFFGFIDKFKQNITFISDITDYWLSLPSKHKSIRCLFLPSTRQWQKDWQGIDFNLYDLIFSHATYDGAKAETGILLPGIPPSLFKDYRGKVYSGDIHVPQKLLSGKIEYVGAPYRIRFGDVFRPRVVIIKDNLQTQDLIFPCISKHVLVCSNLVDLIEQANKHNVQANDQVKVRVSLSRKDLPSWPSLKKEIKQKALDYDWQLFGPELLPINDTPITENKASAVYKSSEQVLADFIKLKNLSKRQADIGLSLIKS